MFFHKGKKKELEEIKDIMEMPEEDLPAVHTVSKETHAEGSASAPLFVKVDKYRDIITSIQEMKLYVSSSKQIFAVLQEVEGLKADTINVLRATLQRLERSITEIDAELLRPQGVSIAEAEKSTEVTHIESSLSELQKQLLDLKKELQGMK